MERMLWNVTLNALIKPLTFYVFFNHTLYVRFVTSSFERMVKLYIYIVLQSLQ